MSKASLGDLILEIDKYEQLRQRAQNAEQISVEYGIVLALIALTQFFVENLSSRHLIWLPGKKLPSFCDDLKKQCRKTDVENYLRRMKVRAEKLKRELGGGVTGVTGVSDTRSARNSSRIWQPISFEVDSKNCRIWFSTVVGMETEKKQLESSFISPSIYPRLFPETSKGILLYGPPGVGKTFLMKAAVNELASRDPNLKILFFAPTAGELKGSLVGETEQNIRALFAAAEKQACDCMEDGKTQALSIIFFDEADSIAPSRSGKRVDEFSASMTNTLLQSMDGVNSSSNIAVIAATNYPWNLDSAFVRRLQQKVYFDIPSADEIEGLLNFELQRFFDNLTRDSKRNDCSVNDAIDDLQKFCENECVPVAEKEISFWTDYANYMPGLSRDDIQKLAQILKSGNYGIFSNSDVSRLVSKAIEVTGNSALDNGIFFEVSDGVFVSSLSFDGKNRFEKDIKILRQPVIYEIVIDSVPYTARQYHPETPDWVDPRVENVYYPEKVEVKKQTFMEFISMQQAKDFVELLAEIHVQFAEKTTEYVYVIKSRVDFKWYEQWRVGWTKDSWAPIRFDEFTPELIDGILRENSGLEKIVQNAEQIYEFPDGFASEPMVYRGLSTEQKNSFLKVFSSSTAPEYTDISGINSESAVGSVMAQPGSRILKELIPDDQRRIEFISQPGVYSESLKLSDAEHNHEYYSINAENFPFISQLPGFAESVTNSEKVYRDFVASKHLMINPNVSFLNFNLALRDIRGSVDGKEYSEVLEYSKSGRSPVQ